MAIMKANGGGKLSSAYAKSDYLQAFLLLKAYPSNLTSLLDQSISRI